MAGLRSSAVIVPKYKTNSNFYIVTISQLNLSQPIFLILAEIILSHFLKMHNKWLLENSSSVYFREFQLC